MELIQYVYGDAIKKIEAILNEEVQNFLTKINLANVEDISDYLYEMSGKNQFESSILQLEWGMIKRLHQEKDKAVKTMSQMLYN